MGEFIIRNFPTILTALLLIVFVLRSRQLGSGIGYLIAAMGISTAINAVAYFINSTSTGKSTAFLFVVGILVAVYLCFFLYFRNLSKDPLYRKLHNIIIGLALATYIISVFVLETFFTVFPSETFFAVSLLLLFSMTLFIIETFNSDVILNITRYFPIWVMTGILIVYIGLVPLMLISNAADTVMNVNTFRVMVGAINVVGYGLMLVGALYAKKV